MSPIGPWNYTYDNEGNRIKKVSIATGETWNYVYNNHNQLTRVEYHVSDGGQLLAWVNYQYDALDRQIERDASAGNQGIRYVYDGNNVIADLGADNSLATYRLYGPGVNDLVARVSAAGTVAWYLTDYEGSVIGLVNASGSLLGTISYDAFGNVLSDTTGGASDRYLFQGEQWDSVISLYKFGLRQMDSHMGTFISEDPGSFMMGDVNLMRFVGNAPTNWLDPSGMSWVSRQIDSIDNALSELAQSMQNSSAGKWMDQHIGDPIWDEAGRASVDSNNEFHTVGQPGFWESMIPFWGSGRAAFDDAQNGRYWSMALNAFFFATDVFLVRSLLKLGIGLIKNPGSLRVILARGGPPVGRHTYNIASHGGHQVALHSGAEITEAVGRQQITAMTEAQFRAMERRFIMQRILPIVNSREIEKLIGKSAWTCFGTSWRAWMYGLNHIDRWVLYLILSRIIGREVRAAEDRLCDH